MTGDSGRGRVALVTGAGRGVGQGVALGLAQAGWTVAVTGRSAAALDQTLARVTAEGGRARALLCDHADDVQVTTAVADCVELEGRLDLLVNNVWAGPPVDHSRPGRFWERPLGDWDTLIGIGLRTHYVASVAAAGVMVGQGDGVIVNISSFGARHYLHSVLYGMSKVGLDKMTSDMAYELRPHGVTVLSLWPGLVQTDRLLASGIRAVAGVPVEEGETPVFQGRVIAALAADPDRHSWTGHALVSAEVAQDYRITDDSGRQPRSHREFFGGGPVIPPP